MPEGDVMKSSIWLKFCVAGIALSIGASALPESLPQIAQNTQRNVIVILRDQLPAVPPVRGAMDARAASVAASQVPLIAQLQRSRARQVHSFSLINAFATSVSPDEAMQLAAHPEVQAVVPDAIIRQQPHEKSVGGATTGAATAANATPGPTDNGLCNTLEPQALQLTHAAYLDPSKPQAQQVLDGNGQTVIGRGVTVAFLADGLDPNIAGFIRPDGSHVFVDYQDFSGDPAGTPTAGGEAFGDASSIAAQDDPNGKPLLFDISKFVSPAHALPSPCYIRIRGIAPGASLVGLKVFSNLGYTTTSSFVQAIEYAVTHDHVDVINESFGGNPFPDQADDPVSLADQAAVAAGVTVVASSGDAGTNGTIGSPATDPWVISAGASTQFRFYRQTGDGAQALAHGDISDNISSFSSGGFAQRMPRTVDEVAPGDLGWALCSTNETLYTDCTNFDSTPQPTLVESFGGTSEAAPLTSGEAALIIQAYRSTHHGADPTPALIKQIIMSTATDLGAPSSEQGAGLIDTLAAVNAALSIADKNGKPKAQGNALLSSPTSSEVVSSPNAHETRSFTITNTGSTTRHMEPSLQTLGPPIAGTTLNVTLDPATDPTFPNVTGSPRAYVERKFTVPAGAEHLDAAIAWQVSLTSLAIPIAYLALLDPSGRQAAYTIPQGLASAYGHVDVVHPAAGTWTAVIWTRIPSLVGSYSGPVQFTWAAENYVPFGSVHPGSLDLAPGASATITADFMMPSEPGDLATAIRFAEPAAESSIKMSEIPITLRTLIPIGPTGGDFTGTLTGGNGRPYAGPTQTYEFDVPNGVSTMSLSLDIADNGYLLEGLLVDPHGMELSVEANLDPLGDPQYALQLFRENPEAGRWKFVLMQDYYSSGNQTSLPFTARIGFNNAAVSVSGLPDSPSTSLSASGKPVTVTIQVTNTGAVTEAYFADARLRTYSAAQLLAQPPCSATKTLPGTCALFYVPTQVNTVAFAAQSTATITMDAYNETGVFYGFTGAPDLWAQQVGHDIVVAVLGVPEVPYGPWVDDPALVGPFGPAGAPTTPVKTAAFAILRPFDAAVSASSGDIWADLTLGTNTFNPLILATGETGIITLTLTPNAGDVGNTVMGFVFIDTYNPNVSTGDEVVRIPYSYTITK
jgi:hypothetical protein